MQYKQHFFSTMSDIVSDAGKYLIASCSESGQLKTFKPQGVKRLIIECATERHDNETHSRVQAILDSQGEHASVEVHKNCYCSFISKDNLWPRRGSVIQ